jgi:hypothetical protein
MTAKLNDNGQPEFFRALMETLDKDVTEPDETNTELNMDDYPEFTIPHNFMVGLINGDISNLSDEEADELVEFELNVIKKYGPGHWHDPEDVGVESKSDLGNQGADMYRTHYIPQSTFQK